MMKKKEQIQRQRAASRFEKQVETTDPVIQLALPMKQVVSWLQEGVGGLPRQAGTQLMQAGDGGRSPTHGRRQTPARQRSAQLLLGP